MNWCVEIFNVDVFVIVIGWKFFVDIEYIEWCVMIVCFVGVFY